MPEFLSRQNNIPLRNHFAKIWYIPTVALPLRLIGFEGTSQSIAVPFRSFSEGGLGIILFCNLKAEGYISYEDAP